jgi:hypothetical protein
MNEKFDLKPEPSPAGYFGKSGPSFAIYMCVVDRQQVIRRTATGLSIETKLLGRKYRTFVVTQAIGG